MWIALFSIVVAAAICLGVAAVLIQGGPNEVVEADALQAERARTGHLG
jgi:hypothetical protein